MFDEEEQNKSGEFDDYKSSKAEQVGEGKEYTLCAERLSRNKSRMERRTMKNRLGDRRSKVRLEADGSPQLDRRLANRIANAKVYKKTG